MRMIMVMIYDDQGTKVFLINGTIKVFYWSLMMIYPIDDDEFFSEILGDVG